jgi:methionyl-tRNA synthetase
MLNLEGVRPSAPGEPGGEIGWDEAGKPLLQEKTVLGEPVILFEKVEDAAIAAQVRKLEEAGEPAAEAGEGAAEERPYAELNGEIVYDDFARLDLRAGLVTHAERIPKSKKLLRVEVDLGFEQRQILAGVAQHMTPEDLVGKRVVVVANLAPRTMMGLESRGMLLMAEDREGNLSLISTNGEAGSVVR